MGMEWSQSRYPTVKTYGIQPKYIYFYILISLTIVELQIKIYKEGNLQNQIWHVLASLKDK